MGRKDRERKNREKKGRPPKSARPRRASAPSPRAPGTAVPTHGGKLRVETTPIQTSNGSSSRATRIARHTTNVFVLGPSWVAYLVGLGLTLLGSSAGLACTAAAANWVWNGFASASRKDPGGFIFLFLALSIAALWIGLRLVTWTVRFDKRTGRMTRRVLWQTKADRPLTDVAAVQCLYAGVRSSGGPRGGSSWHAYQLNVAVLGPVPRVNVCEEPSGPWVRATAIALAGFLGVVLVDHFDQTGAPCDRQRPGVLRRLWGWACGNRSGRRWPRRGDR